MSVKGLEFKCLKDQDSKVGGGSERNRSKEGKGKEAQGKTQLEEFSQEDRFLGMS